jgi:hypothetical protein
MSGKSPSLCLDFQENTESVNLNMQYILYIDCVHSANRSRKIVAQKAFREITQRLPVTLGM